MDNQITNVVFVAADVHGTIVNNVTYQTAVGQPQQSTSAFEVTTGSVAFDAPFGPTNRGIGVPSWPHYADDNVALCFLADYRRYG